MEFKIVPRHSLSETLAIPALALGWKCRRVPALGASDAVRTDFSGGVAEHQVAPAVPDDLVAAVVQDAAADLGDVDVPVALDQVGEVVAQVHELGDDPAVEPGEAQPVADHAVGE